jgi:hypothetical protein
LAATPSASDEAMTADGLGLATLSDLRVTSLRKDEARSGRSILRPEALADDGVVGVTLYCCVAVNMAEVTLDVCALLALQRAGTD